MKLFSIRSLLLLGFVLLSAQSAPAADNKPAFDWTGPYVGLHLGGGWANGDTNSFPLPNAETFGILPAGWSQQSSGVIGGLQAGYNYQMGCWVAGVETDFSGSGISGTKTVSPILRNDSTPLPGGGALTSREAIDWFGTLRLRLGYTVTDSLLFYGTGGLAYGNVSTSANTDLRPLLPIDYPSSVSRTTVGWAAGAGVEYAFSKCWTLRVEYLYIDMGSRSAVANPNMVLDPATRVGYKWQLTDNIVSLGVNFKF
ncbi:MAG: porin family protein [Syntrophobacteraceae bacterium]|nr:porin family protein [Syntrophobacteraceae bacterium]